MSVWRVTESANEELMNCFAQAETGAEGRVRRHFYWSVHENRIDEGVLFGDVELVVSRCAIDSLRERLAARTANIALGVFS